MRPVQVRLEDGLLKWVHFGPRPYTVYVRGFKETGYSVYAVTKESQVPFDLIDVQVQIKCAGEQPSLSYDDDFYIFSEDRVHASQHLSLSFIRDIFRNQLPEQFTKRYDDESNITKLAEQLSAPGDWLLQNLYRLNIELAEQQRKRFSVQNRQSVRYTGKFTHILAYEYSWYINGLRAVPLSEKQPTAPDAIIVVYIDSFDALNLFAGNVRREPIERTEIFADAERYQLQFDLTQSRLYVVSPKGSVIQDVALLENSDPAGFDTDGEYIYVLDNAEKSFGPIADTSNLGAQHYRFEGSYKVLRVYRMQQHQRDFLYPMHEIRVELSERAVQFKMLEGQMLQLLEDGRIQFLQPRYYSYELNSGDVILHDTFPQMEFHDVRTGSVVFQKLRRFELVKTSVDDLLFLFGMHRSRAEEPARQLVRLFKSVLRRSYVTSSMLEQIDLKNEFEVIPFAELENRFGKTLIDTLVKYKLVPNQPTFSGQVLDKTSVVDGQVAQLSKTRYDEGKRPDTHTSVWDALQRRVHLLNSNPVQCRSAQYNVANQYASCVPADPDDVPYKLGAVFVPVQPEVLNKVVHVSNIDASLIQSELVNKVLIFSICPYDAVVCKGEEFPALGSVWGMHCYQVDAELLRGEISLQGKLAGLTEDLIVFDMQTVAYQNTNGYIQFSMPIDQAYVVKKVSE